MYIRKTTTPRLNKMASKLSSEAVSGKSLVNSSSRTEKTISPKKITSAPSSTTTTTTTTSIAATFEQYLKQFQSKPGEGYTHTRIPDKKLNVYGGSYTIPQEELANFWAKYNTYVFENGKQEFLTEKQNASGPLVVDFDFRYNKEVEERKHTKDHIMDAIQLYFDTIDKLQDIQGGEKIPVYVFQKSDVNLLDDVTKDGIHMLVGVQMDRALQVMVRNHVLKELPNIWTDLPLINSWPEVLDEGITKGHTNWQLYGSRKPGHKAYLLKYIFVMEKDATDMMWSCEELPAHEFNRKERFAELSVQYTGYKEYPVLSSAQEEYDNTKQSLASKKTGGSGTGTGVGTKKLRLVKKNNMIEIESITSHDVLKQAIEMFFDTLDSKEYEMKEAHNYTMILPESYYGPGSYTKWIRTGWALKNTSDKLFLTWLAFSSQAGCRNSLRNPQTGEFDWKYVPELYAMWDGFTQSNGEGLTMRSIMYWAKSENLKEFTKVRKENIEYHVQQTICSETIDDKATDVDLAVVLYHIFKDRFVCASVKNNQWYEFIRNRWVECDQGNSLRMLISKDMYDIYTIKQRDIMSYAETLDPNEEACKTARRRSKRVLDICTKLKTTAVKNNIMREVRELFYDKDFIENMNAKPHLMCFNNGVIDFTEKTFRRGLPDDNITKCTKIDYVPLDTKRDAQNISEITDFMEKLFPDPDLRRYMWDHLASVLIGVNREQSFNIYLGAGSNGKSKLVELMSMVLGEYKASVPITLITQKRQSIGGTSSEIAQLMGVRYAVIQEPSKGDRLNEGIMKEITGGDPIQGRALFKDTVTFVSQFKLVVCTNSLFDIKSNDNGTWRRIRLCDFESKFCENPRSDDPEQPHQYLVDQFLDVKMKKWSQTFMAMLVERAFKTNGIVASCKRVEASSDNYRNSQDYLAEFIAEKIRVEQGSTIKKNNVWEEFKKWYGNQYGGKLPKCTELTDYLSKKFGKPTTGGWKNLKLVFEFEEPIDEFEEEPDV